MAEPAIHVTRESDHDFLVRVDAGTVTEHRVTVPNDYFEKLRSDEESKEQLIERSFQFLLERESNRSILPSFELSVIQRYFPEYESTIGS